MLKKFLFILLFIIVALVSLAFITHKSLPANVRTASYAQTATTGVLAEQFADDIAAHKNLSGIYPLRHGQDAFLARLALVEAAAHTLDIQYYIWHDDISGHLLLQQIYKAADRGVRVRLLLDDNNTGGKDALLSAFDAHPNIELRLFNPFMQRKMHAIGYLSDFFRLNRRMHNKSLTADGIATIVGGRNIGDEYFGAGSGVMFADLDVLAIGNAAQAVGRDFDHYWASESSYPSALIIQQAAQDFDITPRSDSETKAYLSALEHSEFAQQLQAGSLPLTWAKADLISDDPAKGLGKQLPQNTVLAHISPLMKAAKSELLIVSPYFVPTKQGTQLLSGTAKTASVTALTNSLSATDVAPVHAGYAKYRKDLLSAGVQLYELKPDVTITDKNAYTLVGSGASLHAKTFSIDNEKLFVGSFNMDPRSAELNTEMGLMLHDATLARQLKESLTLEKEAHTYFVTTNHNNLQWQTVENGQAVVYDTEPKSSWLQRTIVAICAILPIEWLL